MILWTINYILRAYYLARSLYDSTPGHMAFEGVPNIRNIRYIWSISESPLNKARSVAISDMIAPTAHISTGVEYR